MNAQPKDASSQTTRWPQVSWVRVLIADDHPVVRLGVRNMLHADSLIQIVGEAGDGNTALDLAIHLTPDVLLLDITMSRLSGLEVLQRISAHAPAIKVVLFTASITTQQIIEALQTGARAIVLKNSIPDQLIEAIKTVAAGSYWINGKSIPNLAPVLQELKQEDAAPKRKIYHLTPREMEVVTCIVEGCSNRDIASQFSISQETVKRHISNIFDKTGVSTRLELALFAIAHELVTPVS